MESICNSLLDRCLLGQPWTAGELQEALAVREGREFLSVVVERLGDLFEPRLCDAYTQLFSQAIQTLHPDLSSDELESRYRRIRQVRQAPASVARVYVLSRITLGADVAVTSVILDAAKRRYPDAEIVLVGPLKSYELFEADPRIQHQEAPYARSGSLEDRLTASRALLGQLEDGIVLDPDSRLTQLGLIPVCADSNYFFFESRSYGGDGTERLSSLAARWAWEVLGVEGARPYVSPRPFTGNPADITVSLGVGENSAKRLGGDFEVQLLTELAAKGTQVLVDKGLGAEEKQRVERALQPGMKTHDGAFAPFAAQIMRSRLYVGYDSAGGHVAGASGVPVICIFSGEASERMLQRWRPEGVIIRGSDPDPIARVREALATCTFRR